jgi:hypothetical protein
LNDARNNSYSDFSYKSLVQCLLETLNGKYAKSAYEILLTTASQNDDRITVSVCDMVTEKKSRRTTDVFVRCPDCFRVILIVECKSESDKSDGKLQIFEQMVGLLPNKALRYALLMEPDLARLCKVQFKNTDSKTQVESTLHYFTVLNLKSENCLRHLFYQLSTIFRQPCICRV